MSKGDRKVSEREKREAKLYAEAMGKEALARQQKLAEMTRSCTCGMKDAAKTKDEHAVACKARLV